MQPFRLLRRSPALSAVAIASLALGIGANVTVYSIVRELILDDISARETNHLAYINADVSPPLYRELRATSVFQDLAAFYSVTIWAWRTGNHSETAWVIRSSGNFFDTLGATSAFAGRIYSQADEGRDVAVVRYSFWRTRMGSDPGAVGKTLQLNGRLYSVIGILPPDYRSIYGLGFAPEVYVPSGADSGRFLVFGRFHAGRNAEQTRQALVAAATAIGGAELGRKLGTFYPIGGLAGHSARKGDPFFAFFITLYAVAAMLALIACSNVAGLLLARSLSQRREIAIRTAIGAGRWQIVRHLLAEGCALVAAGTVLGYLVYAALVARLRLLHYPGSYGQPYEFHFSHDFGLLLYTGGSAIFALLLSSLIPALRGSIVDPALALRQSEPSFAVRRWNLRSAFVALQMALSVVLLTVGLLYSRGLVQLVRTDAGFDRAHTLFAGVQPLHRHSGDPYFAWREELLRRVRSIPGVAGASSTTVIPLSGGATRFVRREGEAPLSARDLDATGVGDGYFSTMRIPILYGRDFETADRVRKPLPVIVNRQFAREFYGGGDAIGRRLVIGREREELAEIVGVCADTRVHSLGENLAPVFYTPGFDTGLVVRVYGDPRQWIEPLRRTLGGVDPEAALDVRTIKEATAGAIWPMQVASAFLVSLAALGLILALIGLYASVSYAVGRRTREMGIRAALGATPSRILGAALYDTAWVLSIGALAGLAFAIAAVRPLAPTMPAGIDPWSPAMFGSVLLVLLSCGAVATMVPARRATRIDPSVALRE
jgi:putative ABC transport system permease protein